MNDEIKTPWTFVSNSWHRTTIYDADEMPLARLDLEYWGVTEDNQDVLEKRQADLAAFIVKAVNAHENLVEALEDAISSMDQQMKNPSHHIPFSYYRIKSVLASLKGKP